MKQYVEQLIGKLKGSYELECSPVAYTVVLVEKAFNGEMDRRSFSAQYSKETGEAQFFFSYMPKEHIEENKRLFGKEFTFGDHLTYLAQRVSSLTEEEFQAELCKCVEDYLASRA